MEFYLHRFGIACVPFRCSATVCDVPPRLTPALSFSPEAANLKVLKGRPLRRADLPRTLFAGSLSAHRQRLGTEPAASST